MKKFTNYYKALFLLLVFSACTEDDIRDLSYLSSIDLPANVSALYNITQDNTGLVTITPSGDGAVSYDINFGDSSSESTNVVQGNSAEHTYAEGTYEIEVIAYNLNGDSVSVTQELIVSFQAPQNLVVLIENDAAISKRVNVTTTADFATMYEFYSGEAGVSQPVATGNIGDAISYQYAEPGMYTVSVIAMGGAIATTEFTTEFEVTEILAPVASAPLQPSRNESDVISIYSSVYTDVAGTDTFPDWGQGGQGSSWGTFDLGGDAMLQYTNLSYQGIQFGSVQDVSSMEFIHLDVWTADVGQQLETSLISLTGEKPVVSDLTPNAWTSLNIPISAFTDQGLTVADIHQLKFVGLPWAEGTVFIDNIYFYKAPSGVVTSSVEDFEGTAPTFISFGNIADIVVIANPDASGINTTANVAQFTKTAGAEVWAGMLFELDTPLDLVNYSKISLNTWSPKVGAQVKFKLENADASIVHEVDLNTTVANEWEKLVYDFSSAPVADYIKLVIFFDFGNSGDDSVYYFDEIELVNDSGGVPPSIFQDFEGAAPAFTVFGNIADIEVIANPDATGINTTSNVAKLTKTAGSEVWAGTFFEVASALDFATYSKISVKTWSPKVGAQVKLKLENADASIVHEVDLNTTTANAWEELVYDFSAAATADYVKVVIFFDFGNSGDDSLYYYDELTLTN